MLYLGADHRGFQLKESLKQYLVESGQPFEDVGNTALDPDDDYPDFAAAVGKKVSEDATARRGGADDGTKVLEDATARRSDKTDKVLAGEPTAERKGERGADDGARRATEDPGTHRGIVLCGSGIGVDIIANKFRGVRAGLCTSVRMAEMGRNDDDINVLALAADFTDEAEAKKIVKAFLETKFSGEERYVRRIQKITKLEQEVKN